MSKSIFKSRTFWVNAAGVGVWALQHFLGVQVISPSELIGLLAGSNVATRLVTDQPVHIVPPTN